MRALPSSSTRKQLAIEDVELTPEFTRAFELMDQTGRCAFITGKAGTGKSTLLRYFRAKTQKNVAVLAPTGVAAINVEGQTIHSFLRLPPRFIQREDVRRLSRNRRVIERLDTLVIDEASMVRADLMDAVDWALRLNREKPKIPFGGVQVILFGDLFQLPPVVDRDMAEVFEHRYESPYFFSADVIRQIELECLELTRIYRQSEPDFIELLNRVRGNQLGSSDLARLNERVVAESPVRNGGFVTLTTTNQRANEINQSRLNALAGRAFRYRAGVTGEFEEALYPNDPNLALKKGAQVMLIKNDPGKRWVNGTIGRVEHLSDNAVTVSVDGRSHDVPRSTWKKIRYVFDENTGRIQSQEIGSFEQYPIKLAWAITIHKSQGQTFDRVLIELGDGAFAHGQVYVALSRCTSFSGLRLRRPVTARDVIFDERILDFRKRWKSSDGQLELDLARPEDPGER